MFFLALIVAYIVCYYLFTYSFQLFFEGKISKTHFSLVVPLWIFLLFLFFIALIFQIPDEELANRLQHAIGGGFFVVAILFFSLKASQIKIRRLQFFVISLLVATFFGVLNELAESILQSNFGLVFALNIFDTWLDLWANTFGALLGGAIFTVFLKNKK